VIFEVTGAFYFWRCKMNIGIVGARKYQDKQSVIELVMSLPADATIITSSCKGVCTWAKEAAEERGIKVTVFAPNLENIRAWFDIPKRYYQRNKEMVEACDLLHGFISAEDGFIGGTRFEVEYAVSLGIPTHVHRENGNSEWIFQYSFSFNGQNQSFLLSWEDFFHRIRFELGGSR
jgi:hypothetical protein